MKYSELEKRLKSKGCYFIRNGKRHPIWFSPITGKRFTMSHHKSQEVKKDTLNSILKAAGTSLEKL